MPKINRVGNAKVYHYEYIVYNTQNGTNYKHRYPVMSVGGDSISEAVKKAGFDWLPHRANRKGIGHTNARVLVWDDAVFETEGENGRPDFIMERYFPKEDTFREDGETIKTIYTRGVNTDPQAENITLCIM